MGSCNTVMAVTTRNRKGFKCVFSKSFTEGVMTNLALLTAAVLWVLSSLQNFVMRETSLSGGREVHKTDQGNRVFIMVVR